MRGPPTAQGGPEASRPGPLHGTAWRLRQYPLPGSLSAIWDSRYLRLICSSIVTRPRTGVSLAIPYIRTVKILVSNDDGYRSRGIRALKDALASLAEITVVAPDRNRSGASNSLTLDVPLRVFESEPGVYYVQGTPTDCVHLAISGLFDYEHDMVVSGINDGANLGDDVLYSGTVAAAIEGRFLGLPTVAISLCTTPDSEAHFETAAAVARQLVGQLV